MSQEVTLTVREQKRLYIITQVLAGRWSATQAAAKIELSLRQMRRLLAAFRRGGPAALPHRSRGRPSHRRIPPEIREKVLTLTSTRYPDFNDHHLTDILAEEHGIHLSRCISFVTIRSVFPGRIQRLGSIDLRHLGET